VDSTTYPVADRDVFFYVVAKKYICDIYVCVTTMWKIEVIEIKLAAQFYELGKK